jgi:thiosulfate/3-mercaptopyruvate sulfurtransferase
MMGYSLARFGVENVHVLDGGLDRWKDEGRELSQTFPPIDETSFSVTRWDSFVVGYEEFKEIKDNDDVTLLDARPPAFYTGQGPWIKPGHIPGAINLPWKGLMAEGNPTKLREIDEVKAVLDEKGISEDSSIICSCGTGREATNEFLLFKWYLGFPDVRIYEGSFTEWSSYPDNPTVTGPLPR